MSYVVKAWRGPRHLRATIPLICVVFGGCSAGSDRFSSWSFDSGYEPGPAQNTRPSRSQYATQYPPVQPVQQTIPAAQTGQSGYQQAGSNGAQGSYQLASATPAQSGSGYMPVSRVDLPPLPQGQTSGGTKTADGYGPYNPPPISDGTYTGPRVYTPYDGPAAGASPPPPGYYGPQDGPPAPRGEGRVYEPVPERGYGNAAPYGEDRGPGYGGPPERGFYRQQGHWHDRGEGETVRVQQGDTLYALARRYGVTVDMIARANGLASLSVRPGTELFIPRADPAAYSHAQGTPPNRQVAGCLEPRCHAVKPGDTVASLARAYGVTGKQIADANNLREGALKLGQSVIIPQAKMPSRQALASAGPEQAPAPAGKGFQGPAPGLAPIAPQPAKPAAQQTAPVQPAPEIRTAELTPVQEPTCEAALANPAPRMGNSFRKPVEGKTIAPFGPQKDGTVNEGVTISVPKGTPIKAAENGVVAYVGDELPGFGNLILIRHADEYVTAYAHADTILVKKCEIVKRGQTVATAGTTGDAGQPQLHFEIRKNSKPVDPGPLLGS